MDELIKLAANLGPWAMRPGNARLVMALPVFHGVETWMSLPWVTPVLERTRTAKSPGRSTRARQKTTLYGCSPSSCGTGCSSTGRSGCPLWRSRRKTWADLVICASASILRRPRRSEPPARYRRR